jgi:hypothetical protein
MNNEIKWIKPSKKKLEDFKREAQLDYQDNTDLIDIQGITVFNSDTNKMMDGFLYVNPDMDDVDQHCDECMNNLVFFGLSKDEDFPYYAISAHVGLAKWEKMKNYTLKSHYEFKLWGSLLGVDRASNL